MQIYTSKMELAQNSLVFVAFPSQIRFGTPIRVFSRLQPWLLLSLGHVLQTEANLFQCNSRLQHQRNHLQRHWGAKALLQIIKGDALCIMIMQVVYEKGIAVNVDYMVVW